MPLISALVFPNTPWLALIPAPVLLLFSHGPLLLPLHPQWLVAQVAHMHGHHCQFTQNPFCTLSLQVLHQQPRACVDGTTQDGMGTSHWFWNKTEHILKSIPLKKEEFNMLMIMSHDILWSLNARIQIVLPLKCCSLLFSHPITIWIWVRVLVLLALQDFKLESPSPS